MSDDLRNRVARAIDATIRIDNGFNIENLPEVANAALAEMGGVRVKPLEWKAYNEIGHGRCHYGSGVFGHWYAVSRSAKAQWSCSTHNAGKMRHLGYFPALEAAKAAAQADYEAHLFAAIEPALVSTYTEEQVCELLRMSRQGPPGSLAFPVGDAVLRALTEPAPVSVREAARIVADHIDTREDAVRAYSDDVFLSIADHGITASHIRAIAERKD